MASIECKLWRNPEARREAVVQIIDYAHGMASWAHTDLDEAIRGASIIEGEAPPTALCRLVDPTIRWMLPTTFENMLNVVQNDFEW